jgi:cell division protein FtsX
MLKPEVLTGRIYLRGDYYGSFSYSSDSASLTGITGIRSSDLVSKEEAKKDYIADENKDWSKILDANPLPNSIEIKLENKNWTGESLNELQKKILEKLIMASEVSFPAILVKKSEDYFFFGYKRIKRSK